MRRRLTTLREGAGDEEAVINLTPLIDVVFVVLIVFILVAPMLEVDRVKLAAANPETQQLYTTVHDQSPVTIHVRADDSIWFNKENVTPEVLRIRLEHARAVHLTAKPQVFHDKRATFGTYQTIKNAIEAVGFEEMDIVLTPSR